MRDALVDAVVALDEAREALGRIRVAELPSGYYEDVAGERERLEEVGDVLAAALDEEAHAELVERLDERGADRREDARDDVAESESRTVPPAVIPEGDACTLNPRGTVASVDWQTFDGGRWPSQTFQVGVVGEALNRVAREDEHTRLRVSLPRFDGRDGWPDGRMLAIESRESSEVVFAAPVTFDDADGERRAFMEGQR